MNNQCFCFREPASRVHALLCFFMFDGYISPVFPGGAGGCRKVIHSPTGTRLWTGNQCRTEPSLRTCQVAIAKPLGARGFNSTLSSGCECPERRVGKYRQQCSMIQGSVLPYSFRSKCRRDTHAGAAHHEFSVDLEPSSRQLRIVLYKRSIRNFPAPCPVGYSFTE